MFLHYSILLVLICAVNGFKQQHTPHRIHMPLTTQHQKDGGMALHAIYLGSELDYKARNRVNVLGLECEVIESAILDWIPRFEVHHIVVVRDTLEKNGGVYAIDFSPLNQASLETLTKLTFCQSVPGEIRVRHIPEGKVNIGEIKNNCMCVDLTLSSLGNMLNPIHHSSMGTLSHLRRKRDELSKDVGETDNFRIALGKVKNRRIADAILQMVQGWNTNMNL